MDYQNIKLKKEDWLATLTLSRPQKMNALSKELQLEMQHAMDDLEADETIRAVIINGEGKCFSAGFDITGTGGEPPTVQDWRAGVKRENDTWFRIWRSRLPYIAAVHGYCLGGACELSMVCDITIAAEDAQFGEPEIQFQSAPPFPIMPWVLGMKKTKELLLTGDRIDAMEAHRIGLVNRVVPTDELAGSARELARKLSMIPPPAMHLNKQSLNRQYDIRGFQSTVDYGAEIFTLVLTSDSQEKRDFDNIAAEHGLKAAFKWRDEKFAAPRN
ncbi:enoyl-CoA hydratase/isomerase family protein [Aquamicrobium sp. NLF2-7]|uniref:enoyl-CoA hydratase/isomerase family protein n=1 Tax=Aquamicrobium sp. NLF2-7 TaxID=2918753 RepID=UPI001EFA43BB|nr:enoyl-CoA hydratase/isomerase family protein [Aquamicrobium sp. NLF2-7]MCG8273247.1 enoyl-CoA hydratase/isomerase family protein [Aquamicrobium sp. NLF2-7]